MKKVAIIGAGFTGLSAAYILQQKGYDVTVFEKEKNVGGLSSGFKGEGWKWPLEFHYHHLFTNDNAAISFLTVLKVPYQTLQPETSILKNGKVFRFDSPFSLLKFPLLNFFEKIRVGFVFLLFKLFSLDLPLAFISPISLLENSTAFSLIPRLIGKKSFEILFKPLFTAKFGVLAEKISAIWFWARIKKRTTQLIYPDGGFQNFAEKISNATYEKKGKILLNTAILKLDKQENFWRMETATENFLFDKVLITTPFSSIPYILSDFRTPQIKHLDALNLILESSAPILSQVYWLNVNDENYPFLAVVQQTNLVSLENYAGNHVCYLGNYLPETHEFFNKSKEELIELFLPFIQKINPKFKKENIINSYLFRGAQAQPVVDVGYKNLLPPMDLSKMTMKYEGLYLANMDMVYPWDRGVNYAIELGEKAAFAIVKDE